MKWSVITALCIAVFGFIPLMGIPGAVVLSIGEACAQLLNISLICMKGDRAWPAAILATWIWPASIPIAYFLTFKVLKIEHNAARWGVFAGLLFLSSLIVSTLIELLARSEH